MAAKAALGFVNFASSEENETYVYGRYLPSNEGSVTFMSLKNQGNSGKALTVTLYLFR